MFQAPKPFCVAILNYNGADLLRTFMPSVLQFSKTLADVVVIDNASTDDSVALVAQQWPEVPIIRLPGNLGYTGGYKEGLKNIPHEYIVLLNSDVAVTEGWLEPLHQAFESQPHLGAAQPQILWERQPNTYEYAGASGGYIDALGYPFCRGRLFYHLEENHGQYPHEQPIFWASGACLALRKKALEEAGGLDELFFAHMEEIDLCWRLGRAGYQLRVIPSSTVYHRGGSTLGYGHPRKVFLNFRNNLFLLYKNLPKRRLWPTLIARMAMDGLAALKFLTEGNTGHFSAVFKAHIDFYRHLPVLRKKRKTGHLPHLWPLPGLYRGSIVTSFYLFRVRTFDRLIAAKFVWNPSTKH
jgi:GT2 family glycosyltransferase